MPASPNPNAGKQQQGVPQGAQGIGRIVGSQAAKQAKEKAHAEVPEIVTNPDGTMKILTGEARMLHSLDAVDFEVGAVGDRAGAERIPDACVWYRTKECPHDKRRHYKWMLDTDPELRIKGKYIPVSLRNHKEGAVAGAPGLRESDCDAQGFVRSPLGALYMMRASDRKREVDRAMEQYARKVKEGTESTMRNPVLPNGVGGKSEVSVDFAHDRQGQDFADPSLMDPGRK